MYGCGVFFIIFFRTNNATHLEEKNILLFIQKSEELFKIKKIFDPKDEKVFRNLNNSWIILNAIVKLSRHSSRKLRKTEVHYQLSSDWDWDLGLGPGIWDLGLGTQACQFMMYDVPQFFLVFCWNALIVLQSHSEQSKNCLSF